MSNLLPIETKARVRREYRLRILAVSAFVFAGVFAALSLLMTPALVLVTQKKALAEIERSALDQNASATYTESVAAVREANELAVRLAMPEPDISVSKALSALTEAAGATVTIRGVVVNRGENETYDVSLRGVATTRDELASFVRRLEQNPVVSAASVPFTDLAQAVDAEFTATVVIRTSQSQ